MGRNLWLIRVRYQIAKAFLPLFCSIAIASCTSKITREPGFSGYPLTVEEQGLQTEVVIVRNLNIAKSDVEYGKDPRNNGLIVLDVQIKNNSAISYLISREDISILYGDGKKITAMDERKTAKTTESLFGLQLTYPDIKKKYRRWGFGETVMLSPNQSAQGYLFFKAKKDYEIALNGYLSIIALRFIQESIIDTTLPLNRSSASSSGEG